MLKKGEYYKIPGCRDGFISGCNFDVATFNTSENRVSKCRKKSSSCKDADFRVEKLTPNKKWQCCASMDEKCTFDERWNECKPIPIVSGI